MSSELTTITATKKVNETEREATIVFDFGADINEFISLYGAETAHDFCIKAGKIEAQAIMRRCLERGDSEDQITEYMKQNWKPGVTMERISDPQVAIVKKLGTMSQEEQDAYIESLRAKLRESSGKAPAPTPEQ